ncbi:MAG: neuromedin U, partial [Candidatus Latescibacterota bacterium]
FLSPAEAANPTWGVGAAMYLPTASNPEVLGTGQFSLGPTGVVFYSRGKFTLGGVANNVWSIAGDSDRSDVNLLYIQYFVNYNLGNGWAVGTAPIVTANWMADSGEEWSVPWGAQVSKVTHFGTRPVNLLAGYYYYSEHPTGAADYQVRIQVNLLYPSAQ